MPLPPTFSGNILPLHPGANAGDGQRGIPPPSRLNIPQPNQPPEQREVANILRPVPTDQFDRGIDKMETEPYGGGAGTSFVPPIWLTQVDDSNVIVSYGTVGGIVPTTIETNIDLSGTDGTWYIFINATIDASGNVTAAQIDSNTTGVTADSTYAAYLLIGTATVASSIITDVLPSLAWSQDFAACGRDAADPGTTPGVYYFFVA